MRAFPAAPWRLSIRWRTKADIARAYPEPSPHFAYAHDRAYWLAQGNYWDCRALWSPPQSCDCGTEAQKKRRDRLPK